MMVAVGWNGGKRRPTKSLDDKAWWWIPVVTGPVGNSAESAMLMERFDTDTKKLALLAAIRQAHPLGYTPCKVWPLDNKHRYQINAKSPLLLWCGNQDCRRNLGGKDLFNYFASFIINGSIRMDALKAAMIPSSPFQRGSFDACTIPTEVQSLFTMSRTTSISASNKRAPTEPG